MNVMDKDNNTYEVEDMTRTSARIQKKRCSVHSKRTQMNKQSIYA